MSRTILRAGLMSEEYCKQREESPEVLVFRNTSLQRGALILEINSSSGSIGSGGRTGSDEMTRAPESIFELYR